MSEVTRVIFAQQLQIYSAVSARVGDLFLSVREPTGLLVGDLDRTRDDVPEERRTPGENQMAATSVIEAEGDQSIDTENGCW